MSPLAWLRARDRAWRDGWSSDISRPRARAQARIDAALVDHGVLRTVWSNRAEIAPGVWRSNQPSAGQIRRLARRVGLRTVVNLRGANDYGSYLLEREVCERLGLALLDVKLLSREPPKREALHRLREVFETAERPLLLHCKSGADRAGLAAAVYLLMTGAPHAAAQAQLSLRFLHVRRAKTGVLDHFVAAYAAYAAHTPIAFVDWVDTVYDPAAMKAAFRSSRAGDAVVDRLLRRE